MVLREADGPVDGSTKTPDSGGKVIAPECVSEPCQCAGEKTEDHKRYVKELDPFVTVMLLEETPAVLSLGKLCEDHGYTYHWTSGQKPHLTKNGKRIDCQKSNYVPFVVPGLSASSFTTPTATSSSSSSQNSVFDVSRYTENPVPERSGSMGEERRGNPLHRNEGREDEQSDKLHELPDWLQQFRENLVDERTLSEPRGNPELGYRDSSSSSHELPKVSQAKVEPGSGKHTVYTHFPKDPNCDICLKTKKRGLLAEDLLVQSCREQTILVT